jgi:hypothetical protein
MGVDKCFGISNLSVLYHWCSCIYLDVHLFIYVIKYLISHIYYDFDPSTMIKRIAHFPVQS